MHFDDLMLSFRMDAFRMRQACEAVRQAMKPRSLLTEEARLEFQAADPVFPNMQNTTELCQHQRRHDQAQSFLHLFGSYR